MKRALGVVACVLSAGVSIAAPATADPFWLYQGNAAELRTRGHVYTGYSTFGGHTEDAYRLKGSFFNLVKARRSSSTNG